MRYLLLPFLGAALAIPSLQADSLTVSAELYGNTIQTCENTSMDCLVGNKNSGPYAETQYTRLVSGNTIIYTTTMDILGGQGVSYGQGDIVGTINLPSNWSSVSISAYFGGSYISPDFVLIPSFDPHHLPLPFDTTVNYTLDPSTPNTINVVEDAEAGGQADCGPTGCITHYYGTLSYGLTLRGDAPVIDPTPTPEPSSFAYMTLPLLGLFLIRRRISRS